MNRISLLKRAENGVIYLGEKPSEELPQSVRLIQALSAPVMQTVKAVERDLHAESDTPLVLVEAGKLLDKWCGLLESCCLRYGKDYIDTLAFRILLSPSKQLAVMYGNCQMHDYYDCIMLSLDFRRDYEAVYFKYLEYPRWKEERLELLLCLCSVFLYTKEGFDERFRNCIQFVKTQNPDCRTIKIPTYSYRGCFPQTNPHIQEKGHYDIIAETFNSFHREDLTVNRMIQEGKAEDDIVSKVLSGTCFSEESILRGNEIALKQIELMDRASDVSIGAYVKANYQKIRLFKDPVHMENNLVWFISEQLLRIMGYQQNQPMPERTIHYFTELPIYPEVISVLGLEWPEESYHPVIRLAEGMISTDTEGFLRRYCRFAGSAERIRKSLHIQPEMDTVKERF